MDTFKFRIEFKGAYGTTTAPINYLETEMLEEIKKAIEVELAIREKHE